MLGKKPSAQAPQLSPRRGTWTFPYAPKTFPYTPRKEPGQARCPEEPQPRCPTFDLVISLDARKMTTLAVLLSKLPMLFLTTVSIAFRMMTRCG